jgi:hypothetical protein
VCIVVLSLRDSVPLDWAYPDLRPGLSYTPSTTLRGGSSGWGWVVRSASFPTDSILAYVIALPWRLHRKFKVPRSLQSASGCRGPLRLRSGQAFDYAARFRAASLRMTNFWGVMLSGVGRSAKRSSARSRSIPAFARLRSAQALWGWVVRSASFPPYFDSLLLHRTPWCSHETSKSPQPYRAGTIVGVPFGSAQGRLSTAPRDSARLRSG